MISPLPELYFRLRDGGASVFRMVDDARNGRLDMEQVATINLRSGEARLGKGKTLSESEQATVDDWIADRRESPGIGGRIGPWCSANGALVDIDDLVQIFKPLNIIMIAGDHA